MTIIAIKHGVVAASSEIVSSDGIIDGYVQKIRLINYGNLDLTAIIGAAGELQDLEIFHQIMLRGIPIMSGQLEPSNKPNIEDDFNGFLMKKDDNGISVTHYDNKLVPMSIRAKSFAIGAPLSRATVLTAMNCGMSPLDAVKESYNTCLECNGPIIEISLQTCETTVHLPEKKWVVCKKEDPFDYELPTNINQIIG